MKTVVLVVLDGWGIGPKNDSNPIYIGDTKTIKYIEENFPAGKLKSSDLAVGLPWGEEGNSEVGHLTIGAGRIVKQHFLRINQSIEENSFFKKEALKRAFDHAKENQSVLHLVGLLTKGNVHSSLKHLEALLEMAKKENYKKVALHIITDGRDSPPKSAEKLISELKNITEEKGVGEIATISGRYYAMDRDENWDRTERAYKALTGEAKEGKIEEAIKSTYDKNLNDEYVEPVVINKNYVIRNNDAVIFFNFREDRMRQITRAFLDPEFDKFSVKKFENLGISTMTKYHRSIEVPVAFPPKKINGTLGEVISKEGKSQLRVAETEKKNHVTYFFNGLRQSAFENEYRIMIPSIKTPRPAEYPEMMAEQITNRVAISIRDGGFDFILVNYANPDIIAHTGDYRATMAAVKTIDKQINILVREILGSGNVMIITSDHGNAEEVFDLQTGTPETKHDANPVPFYLIGDDFKKPNKQSRNLQSIGMLSDIAPTILDILKTPQSKEMTGSSLLNIL